MPFDHYYQSTEEVTIITKKPPVKAAPVVTYLQFPIQVCFPCISQPVTNTASVIVTDTLVVLIIVIIIIIRHNHYTTHHHHNHFTALFPGPSGSAGARRKLLLDFMVLGRINRGRHTDNPGRCHSIRTNQQSTSINHSNFYAVATLPVYPGMGQAQEYAGLLQY